MHHLVVNVNRSSCHLQCSLHIALLLSFFSFVLIFFFKFTSLFKLFTFHNRWFTIKDPNWFYSILQELYSSVKNSDKMAGKVSLFISKLANTWICRVSWFHPTAESLCSYQKLVNGHWSIYSDNLATEHVYLHRFYWLWALLLNKRHQLFYSHS
jgi:hypothetical protein